MFLTAIVGSRRLLGLVLGAIQLIGLAVALIVYETRDGDSTTSLGTAMAVLQGLGPGVIVITAVTVILVEGPVMFNREWGKKHREAGREEITRLFLEAFEQAGLSPEQKAKIQESLEAQRAEREKEPA